MSETIDGNKVTAIGSLGFANGETEPVYDVTFGVAHTIDNGGRLELSGANSDEVIFSGPTGVLRLDNATDFAGPISGLSGSDALDLADIGYGPNTKASFAGNADGGILTVSDGRNTAELALLGGLPGFSLDSVRRWPWRDSIVDRPSASNGQGGQGPPGASASPALDNMALLRSYMASAFPPEGIGLGSILGPEPAIASGGENLLAPSIATPPHKG